jgi:hypothetical protein
METQQDPLAQLRRHFPGLNDTAVIGKAVRQAVAGIGEDLQILAQRRPSLWPPDALSNAGSALFTLALARQQATAGDLPAAAASIVAARRGVPGG